MLMQYDHNNLLLSQKRIFTAITTTYYYHLIKLTLQNNSYLSLADVSL